MASKIKDPALSGQGMLKIRWAESRMPVLMALRKKASKTKPLKGLKIGGCLHVTKETAVLVRAIRDAGAEAAWCGCNPLSTQDDVAAALAEEGVSVYAWRGLSTSEYYWCITQVLDSRPQLTLDDGADLVFTLHQERRDQLSTVVGGTEETTTGVHRIRAMAEQGKLNYPIMAVNDAVVKSDFDNVYGTGQSSLDGILRATNILMAGKTFAIAGYGHCGRGVANRARGMGANVVVCEVDPVNALRAAMDGFRVMPMIDAAPIADLFITATGCRDIITAKHLKRMKDGAIICNTGHFNVEVSVKDLEGLAKEKREIRPNNTEYTLRDGRRLYLLAEGRLVNLAAAEGHPSEVMDMSFATQLLSLMYLSEKGRDLQPGVYKVPEEYERQIASTKLETMGMSIDTLTREQDRYLHDYQEGT
ncbi:adenosylhomocysteinase [Candidatus Bathyarchaeota archaeon]|jgi:adenosylhomocysteinase|nr:adenosylhomocysteinase [Candidatus Bathyarchaeota archaeon]